MQKHASAALRDDNQKGNGNSKGNGKCRRHFPPLTSLRVRDDNQKSKNQQQQRQEQSNGSYLNQSAASGPSQVGLTFSISSIFAGVVPVLELLLAGDGAAHILEALKVKQPVNVAARRIRGAPGLGARDAPPRGGAGCWSCRCTGSATGYPKNVDVKLISPAAAWRTF